MKKTLLALALLLGTGGAFAQIGIKADAIQKTQKTTLDKTAVYQEFQKQKQQNNLNGRKDGETIETLCDFQESTAYTFVNSGSRGWQLQPNVTTTFESAAPELFAWTKYRDSLYNTTHWYWTYERVLQSYSIPNTGENGFAFLSYVDIERDGHSGVDLTASIKLNTPIYTHGMRGVDIYFNQVLQRFNSERYYIDWSHDLNFTVYDSIEFNVNGIEMNANDFTYETKRVTLPRGSYNVNVLATTEDQPLYVRIRAYAPGSQDQTQGYYWLIDDISYSDIPENRIDVVSTNYAANTYHIIPTGVMLDTVVFVGVFENTGATDYASAMAKNVFNKVTSNENDEDVYTHVSDNESTEGSLLNALRRDTASNGNVSESRYSQFVTASTVLPYQEIGAYSASTILTSEGNIIATADDTLYFNVRGEMENNSGHYRWAKDRNVIVAHPSHGRSGIFTYGFINYGGTAFLTDQATIGLQGYEVCLPYSANDNNTAVKYITGVEVVPAVDSCRAGAKIQGKLRKYNADATAYDNLIIDVEDEWGVPVQSPVYTVQQADLNVGNNEFWGGPTADGEWRVARDFNSIYLEFPNSVRLEPGEIYYACYRMAANGKFAVATDRYIRSFGPGGFSPDWSMLVCQPGINGNYPWGGRLYPRPEYSDYTTPMIRMILGDVASLPEQISSSSSLNAYPNPANGETTISYSLNKSGNVNIVITDMMGRTVKMMNQGNQVAGTSYNVNLNTADLANGTYFYTLSVNGEKQTKKLIVNK